MGLTPKDGVHLSHRIVEIDQQGNVGTYQCNPQAFIVNTAEL